LLEFFNIAIISKPFSTGIKSQLINFIGLSIPDIILRVKAFSIIFLPMEVRFGSSALMVD